MESKAIDAEVSQRRELQAKVKAETTVVIKVCCVCHILYLTAFYKGVAFHYPKQYIHVIQVIHVCYICLSAFYKGVAFLFLVS